MWLAGGDPASISPWHTPQFDILTLSGLRRASSWQVAQRSIAGTDI
jgi:hypothetical protein